jgi:hypothetical protein
LQASLRPSSPPTPTTPTTSSPAQPPHAAAPTPIAQTPTEQNPEEQPQSLDTTTVVPDRIIRITAQTNATGVSKFDPVRIEVMAGQQVEVILRNNEPANSGTAYNWVLIKPGTEPAVAALGKQAGVDPDAVTYSPSILAATKTTRPGAEGIVDFLAPNLPGEYPFFSLIGDQRKTVRGVMIVRPIEQNLGS